jgi:hypothetical protein
MDGWWKSANKSLSFVSFRSEQPFQARYYVELGDVGSYAV